MQPTAHTAARPPPPAAMTPPLRPAVLPAPAPTAAQVEDFANAPISTQAVVRAANPQRERADAGGAIVVAYIPHQFNLWLDATRMVKMRPGLQLVSAEVAAHPYGRGHGVEYIDVRPALLAHALTALAASDVTLADARRVLALAFGDEAVLAAIERYAGGKP